MLVLVSWAYEREPLMELYPTLEPIKMVSMSIKKKKENILQAWEPTNGLGPFVLLGGAFVVLVVVCAMQCL